MVKFFKTVFISLLIVSLFVGTYLRTSKIEQQSLWSDELFSVTSVELLKPSPATLQFERKTVQSLNLSDSFLTFKAAEHTPPLFEALLGLSIKLFGTSETAIRFPSVLASLLLLWSIPLLLFRNFGLPAALCAAVFIAFAPLDIQFAQEARTYALGMCLAGLTTIRLVIVLRKATNTGIEYLRISWLDFLLHMLLAFVHHYGFILSYFLFLPRIAFIMILNPDTKLQVFIDELKKMAGISIIPVIWLFFNWHAIVQASGGGFHFSNETWGGMLIQGLDAIVPGGLIGFVLCITLFFLLFILSLYSDKNLTQTWISKVRSLPPTILISGSLLLISFIYLLLLSRFDSISGNFHVRHFSFILPVFSIGASILIGGLLSEYRIASFPLTILLCLLIYRNLPEIENFRNSVYKEQYREASALIASQYRKGDLILTTWGPNQGFYLFYLRKQIGESVRKDMKSISYNDEIGQYCERIKRKLSKKHRVFIFYHQQHTSLITALQAACPAILTPQTHPFFGVNVGIQNPL